MDASDDAMLTCYYSEREGKNVLGWTQFDDVKVGDSYHADEADTATTATNATNATYAQYASSDTSKGTIEERLTNLGFKTGTCTLGGTAPASLRQRFTCSLTKQGKRVLFNMSAYIAPDRTNPMQWDVESAEIVQKGVSDEIEVTIPNDFLPKTSVQGVFYFGGCSSNYNTTSSWSNSVMNLHSCVTFSVATSGVFTIKIRDPYNTYGDTSHDNNYVALFYYMGVLNLGWETN